MKLKDSNMWINPLHITSMEERKGGDGQVKRTRIYLSDNSDITVYETEMTFGEIINAVEMELAEIIPLYRKIEQTGPK